MALKLEGRAELKADPFVIVLFPLSSEILGLSLYGVMCPAFVIQRPFSQLSPNVYTDLLSLHLEFF